MKVELCEAFCNDISVVEVPAGLAIGTAFRRSDGDKVSFYVIEHSDGLVHLEDDGTTIPYLESAGVDFETDTRRKALDELLAGVGAYFDADEATIRTHSFNENKLSKFSIAFVGLMIRMEDFLLLTQEKVASTFRSDAAGKIAGIIDGRANIRENQPVYSELGEVVPDMVVKADNRPPVAIFFGNTSNRVHDAIFLHQAATYEVHRDVSVVALLEQDNSVSTELRRRASNRLTTVPVFKDDEDAAVKRIALEVLGREAMTG